MSDDALLLQRWNATRDAEAFAELAKRHVDMVYGTCRRILCDAHAAEDVAQECMLELARRAAEVRSSVGGFLHAVATTRSRDHLRNEGTRRRHEAAAGVLQAGAATADDATWHDLSPLVDQALAGLPDEQRIPLVLQFFAGRSQVEIAQELGCSQPLVSRRTKEGIEALRKRLAGMGLSASVLTLATLIGANAAETAPPTLMLAASKMALAGIVGTSAAPVTASLAIGKVALLVAALATLTAGVVWWTSGRSVPPRASALPIPAPSVRGQTYITNFPLSENPLSESGHWLNGPTPMRTQGGLAFGTQAGAGGPPFGDSLAVLSGTWGSDQSVSATVRSTNQQGSTQTYEDLELALRMTISPTGIAGYNITFRCAHDGSQYATIAYWKGAPPRTQSALLAEVRGPTAPGIADGDVITATAIGSVITVYRNHVQVMRVTDNAHPAAGSPGMGCYYQGTAGGSSDFGFTQLTATDAVPIVIPAGK